MEGGGKGGGEGGGGEGGGGEGAPIATKTAASKATATSGLSSTDTPSMADKAANGWAACASALATRAEASAEVLTMFSCRFTLAAVTARLAWHSGGWHENCALSESSIPARATWSKSLTSPLTL